MVFEAAASRNRSYEAEVDRYLQAQGLRPRPEGDTRTPLDPSRPPAPAVRRAPASPRLPAVKVVFVAVRGRARLHVEGIRGRPGFASRLEARIAGAAWHPPGARELDDRQRPRPLRRRKLELRSLIAAVARLRAKRAAAPAWRAPAFPGLTRADSIWHTVSAAAAARALGANPDTGLAADEVARRLATLGENSLPTPAPKARSRSSPAISPRCPCSCSAPRRCSRSAWAPWSTRSSSAW